MGNSLARPDEPLSVDIIAVFGCIESHCHTKTPVAQRELRLQSPVNIDRA